MGKVNNKLLGKINIEGTITVVTGLRIGAGKDEVDLGSPELPIVKTSKGQPFIPGSSLKGKLRSLLGRAKGSPSVEKDHVVIKTLFGESGANDSQNDSSDNLEQTLLVFRDCFIEGGSKKTEFKWENTIDRLKGSAVNPRQLERVPLDSVFNFKISYNIVHEEESIVKKHLKILQFAFGLLDDDYLGGCGSRGYGKVETKFTKIEEKRIDLGVESEEDLSFAYNTVDTSKSIAHFLIQA